MINHRANEIVIASSLKDYLSTEARPCEVVRQNQVAEIPHYPYVSYTVTTPVTELKGTYNRAEDGSLYRDATQIWSFTVQSDDQDEAMNLGMKMADFFNAAAVVRLWDNGISVRRVTNLTARDNLLTIQYEYRKGLDVTFGLLDVIAPESLIDYNAIETLKFKEV